LGADSKRFWQLKTYVNAAAVEARSTGPQSVRREKIFGIQLMGSASQLVIDLPGLRTKEMPSNIRSKLEISFSRCRKPGAVIS
jgi:hypothetical protein